ncbi:hypothetical protein [Brevibacillus laterosporus]|uniref:hypothetical protein n=1 Tax=Brevibacillus laterosporus TaxID=1465 RepID=UPI00068B6FB7
MEKNAEKEKTCFIIMPIADMPGYEPGHFTRVYDHIIKPACEEAGFKPIRADDVKHTNDIVIDIIRKIVDCDMAICDLSGRNPNVLYELGIRHSFGLPVTLLKDSKTSRIFDIQGIRSVDYDESLRIDTVDLATKNITEALKATYNSPDRTNSIIQALGIKPAKVAEGLNLSDENSVLLDAINDVRSRIDNLEKKTERKKEVSEFWDDPRNLLPHRSKLNDKMYDGGAKMSPAFKTAIEMVRNS